jgi:hypothetical protein
VELGTTLILTAVLGAVADGSAGHADASPQHRPYVLDSEPAGDVSIISKMSVVIGYELEYSIRGEQLCDAQRDWLGV